MAKTLSDDALLKLVDALASGRWLSGEALSEAAGISRTALAKRMDKLADWGLIVERQAGRGYRLLAPIERLDRRLILDGLPPRWRETLHLALIPVVDSTNARVLERGSAADPQAVFAELQTAGRGRRGRTWRSPFGANLYLSIGWTFPAWPDRLTALPLAAGAAIAAWLQDIGLTGVAVKWPNDLWVDRRKLGGILIETRGEGGGSCRVVVGVGLNLSMRPEQATAIDQAWTSLAEALPQTPSRNALAGALLHHLLQALDRFQREGFEPFRTIFGRFDAVDGQAVQIHADTVWRGIARGVDESGALLIETEAGTSRVLAGDVSLRFP